MTNPAPKGYPVADKDLLIQVLSLIEIALFYKMIKRGANESIKAIKKGIVELVVIAYDADPIEITLHLPLLCEDKNVPYIFVNSKNHLGKACGMNRGVIACSIITGENEQLNKQIYFIKNRVESLVW